MKSIFRRGAILTTIGVLAAAAVCVRLGTWQIERLGQRRSANERIALMQSMSPLSLPAQVDLESQEFRFATVSGEFDFKRQVALRNQVHEGVVGLHLITPLLIRDETRGNGEGIAILVDRGWIPLEGNESRQGWKRYDLQPRSNLTGVIRLGQPPAADAGSGAGLRSDEVIRTDSWMKIDVAALSEQLPYVLLPVYLELERVEHDTASPVPMVTIPEANEGPHLLYAMQWFAFAVALLLGYPLRARRLAAGKA